LAGRIVAEVFVFFWPALIIIAFALISELLN
jgi:hypothetical protein